MIYIIIYFTINAGFPPRHRWIDHPDRSAAIQLSVLTALKSGRLSFQDRLPRRPSILARVRLEQRQPLPYWGFGGRQEEKEEESVHHKEEKQTYPQASQIEHLQSLQR